MGRRPTGHPRGKAPIADLKLQQFRFRDRLTTYSLGDFSLGVNKGGEWVVWWDTQW